MRTLSWSLLPLVALTALALAPRNGFARVRASATPSANDAIEQAMGQLQRSMKTLGKGITEETRGAALEELAKIESALIAAKGEVPDTAAEVDEKKRDAFVAEYRTTLLEVLKYTCDAEIAVVNGKYKEAEGILRGKMGGLKSSGHDKFKGDDKGR